MSLGALGQPHLLSRLMAVRAQRGLNGRQGYAIVFRLGYCSVYRYGNAGPVRTCALIPEIGNPEVFILPRSQPLPASHPGGHCHCCHLVCSDVHGRLTAARRRRRRRP